MSPTTGASILTVLLISAGSMSIWIFLEFLPNLFALPTIRSSNLDPIPIIRSASSRAMDAYAIPCIPGNPADKMWSSGKEEIPSKVVTTGIWHLSANSKSLSWALEIITPCPASITGFFDSFISSIAFSICDSSISG